MALDMYTMETISGNRISETDILIYVSKSKTNWDIKTVMYSFLWTPDRIARCMMSKKICRWYELLQMYLYPWIKKFGPF